jgi:osmotically-inducible protein OsmY
MKYFDGNGEATERIAAWFAAIVAVVLLGAGSVPGYASKADDRIESSAKDSYVFRTYLKGDDIRVTSSDGAVTLTGIVSDGYRKSLAQETVAGLPGVKRVDNRLEVKGTAPTEHSDGWLSEKVKVALLFHRSVSAHDTLVSVRDGVATLRGEADSQAQKELTGEYAGDVDGIRKVENEMTVKKAPAGKKRTIGEKVDDASISAQVRMVLLYHRSTSALGTAVATRRGIVTLTGKAANAAERQLAGKLAGDVHGVKGVQNRMTAP